MKSDRAPRPDPEVAPPAAEDLPGKRRDPQLVHAIERFIGNLVKPGTRLVYSGALEESLKFLELSALDELLAVTPTRRSSQFLGELRVLRDLGVPEFSGSSELSADSVQQGLHLLRVLRPPR